MKSSPLGNPTKFPISRMRWGRWLAVCTLKSAFSPPGMEFAKDAYNFPDFSINQLFFRTQSFSPNRGGNVAWFSEMPEPRRPLHNRNQARAPQACQGTCALTQVTDYSKKPGHIFSSHYYSRKTHRLPVTVRTLFIF